MAPPEPSLVSVGQFWQELPVQIGVLTVGSSDHAAHAWSEKFIRENKPTITAKTKEKAKLPFCVSILPPFYLRIGAGTF
jgi:hypothetical protein